MEYSTDKTDLKSTQSSVNSSSIEIVQNKAIALQDNRPSSILQKKENNTGLPENLKSGIENLSGHSMDDVKVHYNSNKPAQLNAHAYAQGTDIHIASGQEKHLAHEAWHVVQQKQGRVKPTLQMKGKVNVNDDIGLEKEADVMGAKALQMKSKENTNTVINSSVSQKKNNSTQPIQRIVEINGQTYSSKLDVAFLYHEIATKTKASLSASELILLRTWVRAPGPRSIFGFRLSSGLHKNYEDYEELAMALKGDVGSQKNLKKETDLALKIPDSNKIKVHMNSLAVKIFDYIEQEKANFDKKHGGKRFWEDSSASYRGLWNYVGTPYNFNYYASLMGAFGSGGVATKVPNAKPPLEAFKETLQKPEGNITDIFASMKQVSNVYNDRIGKNKFTTPKLVTKHGQLTPVKGQNEESGEKRYNTQSLKEKEDWTKYARSKNIPVSAGASGSMDRMYRLAQDAGANVDELFALALAGHYVFNQVYTMLSNDPHTFHEIMDPMHKYVGVSLNLGHAQRLKQMEKWMK
ncbi:eCIS core domain-containing protein [Flavobacterium sp. 3-218]